MDRYNERSGFMFVEVLNRQGNTWESQSDRDKKAPTEDCRGF